MMKMPIQYRVSGPFTPKGGRVLYKCWSLKTSYAQRALKARVNYEGTTTQYPNIVRAPRHSRVNLQVAGAHGPLTARVLRKAGARGQRPRPFFLPAFRLVTPAAGYTALRAGLPLSNPKGYTKGVSNNNSTLLVTNQQAKLANYQLTLLNDC